MEIGFGGRENVAAWAKQKQNLDMDEETADRLWDDATRPGGPSIQLSAAGHIEQILRLLPEILPRSSVARGCWSGSPAGTS
jgi:hypothetical protein